jgi:hypothetical protein
MRAAGFGMSPESPDAGPLADWEWRYDASLPAPTERLTRFGSRDRTRFAQARSTAAFFRGLIVGQLTTLCRRGRHDRAATDLVADLRLYRRAWRRSRHVEAGLQHRVVDAAACSDADATRKKGR